MAGAFSSAFSSAFDVGATTNRRRRLIVCSEVETMDVKQSTAATIDVGPILDASGVEYTGAVIGDLTISKNGTRAAMASAATLTHVANGYYTLVMTTGNTDTLGRTQITCNKAGHQMPPISLMVKPANAFDSLVLGTDVLQGDVTQFGGTNLTAASGIPEVKVASIADDAVNAAAIADGAIDTATFATGATLPRVTLVDTTVTNSDMRGTDSALLSSSYTAPDNAGIADVLTRLPDSPPGVEDGLPILNADLRVGAVLDPATRVKLDATQPDYIPATAAALTAAKTILDKVDTGLVQDGAVYQFTANMLELGPAGGGGGGGTDWTSDERATIRAILGIPGSGSTPADPTTGILDTIRDLVVAYIAAALATVDGSSGTIVDFPATLNIGDSYTDDCNSAIHVFIRDENDDPITSVGTHDFTDGDFAPECIITQNGNTGRVKCEVTYVTASPENYLKIQIPSKESRRATPGIATVQVLLKWDGAQKALAKQTVTWEGLI